ncbi:MarR family transcriptional regulator [Paenibacillus lutimineralis]|uniref:MarR family transcriptional regulator n=2 Tax=Paenibacillus lutimineralis TaxID=2707005 RepID=A0A3Q9I977_9BACL|nr:MarR family transcriptional regulator [Paenibacillus lutimineralis]
MMNYMELAEKYLQSMFLFHKLRPQKRITESMQGELFVLQSVYQHEGEIVPSEISKIMGISSARIAATLNSLEKKGLITRQIDLNDRRRIIIGLTQAGKDMAEKHHEFLMEDTATLLSLLGEDDAVEFVRITSKFAELSKDTDWK